MVSKKDKAKTTADTAAVPNGLAERSPVSGTQLLAALTTLSPKITEEKALAYVVATANGMATATLQFIASGAIALIVMAYATGRGAKGVKEVSDHIQNLISERNVKRSQAFALFGTTKQLASKIVEWNQQGGLFRDICAADTPEAATAATLAWLKAEKGVNSYNTLRQAMMREPVWTPEAKAIAEANAAKDKATGKKTREANARAVDRVVEQQKLEPVMSAIAKRDDGPIAIFNALNSVLDKISDTEILGNIAARCHARIKDLKAAAKGVPSGPAIEHAANAAERPAAH